MGLLDRLKSYISKYEDVAIMFSGGCDSTLLSKVAFDVLGNRAIAVTMKSEFLSRLRLDQALSTSSLIGIEQTILEAAPMEVEEIVVNGPDRCYHCKNLIVRKIKERYPESVVFDGTLADDDMTRPGIRALKEHGVVSPLKDCGFTKEDVRNLSRELGLETWNKPSDSCLATRVDGKITADRLKTIDMIETSLSENGYDDLRFRYGDSIARIELYKNSTIEPEVLDSLGKKVPNIQVRGMVDGD